MIVRIVLAGATLALGLTSVLAQSAVLPGTALMREQGQLAYRQLNGMVKGEIPYDKAKAEEAFDKLVDTSKKIPAAYPASSKGQSTADSRFSPSAKVWDNRADFEAHAAKLAKVIEDNRGKVGTLDGLKAVYPQLNDACNACHEGFRVRKS